MAVAVFNTRSVQGEVTFKNTSIGIRIEAIFTRLPDGEHGFHIHRAGDLRGEGCKKACDHYHRGPPTIHGGPPSFKGPRHTGDLGNVSMEKDTITKYTYNLKGIKCDDLWGRSVIIHADKDDYGLGDAEDSKTTGHSGKRIACAVIGRVEHAEHA
jgi:Cu-Zn family superoxide dismutase